jgi:ABC-type multidrug transport system ATPase subunit
VVEVKDVTKTFGSQQVLKRLSLSCAPGETILLVGANGAGKSTLLRIMAGLSRPDSGRVTRDSRSVALLSHHLFLYGRLSVRENLKLFGAVRNVSDVLELAERLDLLKVLDRPVSELSKGTQARVGIARTFISPPGLVLLDEPTSNLDEKGTALLLGEVERGRAVTKESMTCVIATHDLHRLSSIATRVVVLNNGAVATDSGPRASQEAVAEALDRYREVNR